MARTWAMRHRGGTNLSLRKHMELVGWLKAQHQMGHGH
ncbi:DUF4287 domain-containing protein, partial [Delftia acidovorans]